MALNTRGQSTRGGDKTNRPDREPGAYLDSGPYIAVVMNNVDNKRTGTISVYIPNLASDYSERLDVRFASPFISHTRADGKNGDYASSTQTSGMWLQQPDIGSEVLVIFANGDTNQGFWIACVQDRYNNHSLPGFASSIFWDADTDPEKEFLDPSTGKYDTAQAVGEFYDPIKTGTMSHHENVPNPMVKEKPINKYLNSVYKEQGLNGDLIRGHTTSSAQRETPSNVFGISTKGRPVYDAKDNASIIEKLSGNRISDLTGKELDAFKFATRKQGHSVVLDDGDIEGKNNLVRMRSASGHQILLHDTEGVVYIGNAKGTVWIEMDNSGTLDIYSQSSVNVRSNNMNLYADSNINMHAKKNISILAEGKFQVDAGNIDLKSTTTGIKLDSSRAVDIKGSAVNLDASGTINLNAGGDVKIDGSCVELGNGAGGVSGTPVALAKVPVDDTIRTGNGFWMVSDGTINTIVSRVPTHEPFKSRGEDKQEQIDLANRQAAQAATTAELDDTPTKPGPTQARTKYLDKADRVTRGAVIKQPEPNGAVGDLSAEETKRLLAAIGQRESSNNYQAVNQFGYLGKYQMGLAALEDAGYVKPGTFASAQQAGYSFRNINDVLQDPNVWTGKEGVGSRPDFLASKEGQEAAMETFTDRNVATLKRIGVIKASTTTQEQAGLIMASHLKGPGDVKKWANNGGTFTDGNGVSIDTYYNIGRSAIA